MSLPFSAASSYRTKFALPALVGMGLMVFGFLINRHQFFLSYLQGYSFAIALPLGCLALLMIHTLTGGNWGWTIRPFLEAGTKTLPAMTVLFVPVALGLTTIYSWTNPEIMAHDPGLQAKEIYLNAPFWVKRAIGYFIVWNILAFWLRRWLIQSPENVDMKKLHRVQRLSAGGLLIFVLTVSFAAIDWVMSIEPHYFSSIFGAIALVGQGMSAFALSVISLIWLNKSSPNPWLTERNLHDLSKFLFMTVMLWGYMSLSQFLIIWAGNLPEETFWYYERSQGGWWYVSFLLPIFQWALPFCLLLSATMKKRARYVTWVAMFLLFGRAFEQIWLIAPGTRIGTFPIQWMDIAAPIGLGGCFAALYFGYLGRSSGVPAPAGGHGHGHAGPQDQPQGDKH